MTEISTNPKQRKIWTILFIFLLLCFSISATSPIKSISSVSLLGKKLYTVDTCFAKLGTNSMLRQRKTTPVKKALHARGGGEENDPLLSSSIGLEKEMMGTEQEPPQSQQRQQQQEEEVEQSSSQNPTNSMTLETSNLISSPSERSGDAVKSSSPVSGLRAAIFPIHGSEFKKFMLMGAIKFFVIMALTLTRDTKDTLVVTQCGAEAIAFLKIYGVLPAATGFIALYSKLSSTLEKRSLFFTTCIPFFLFFFFFDAFLYPNREMIQPSLETVSKLLGAKGGALDILSKIFSNWTSAMYFVVAELYSSVSVGILFWQFANDVVPIDQAKRFYPLFSQMGGLAPIVAGQYTARFASQAQDFGASMHRLTYAISFAGVMICLFYHLSSNLAEKEMSDAVKSGTPVPKKKKSKMSMGESIKFLASSQYLRLIGMLVLGYGLSINFTEIMWKSLLKKKYPDPLDYQRFIGNFSSAVGFSTCIVILFGVHVIRVLGWRVGAMATPATMALLSVPFFLCIVLGIDNSARLSTAVALGTILSLLSKTAKYALFDPTTQMAYIPLDEESKVKGKAAIDVLGSRMGKSGGSLIQQGLVLLFGNILNASPAVAVIYYSVLMTWLSAANTLSGLFVAKTEMQKAEQATSSGRG